MALEILTPEVNYIPIDIQLASSGSPSSTPVPGISIASDGSSTPINPQSNTPTPAPKPSNITPTGGGSVLSDGTLQSPNFAHNASGWRIDSAGNVEFNDGTFRGALAANTIDIPNATTVNSFHTDSNGNSWWGATTFGAAPASISKTGAAVFSSATITGVVINSKGSFGGDGSDGALSVTSGTTTISLGGAQVVVKQYTSISITGTGTVTFSNPHANGTFIILKSQGAVTLTSSSAPMLNASAFGAAGGATVSSSSGQNKNGLIGTAGFTNFFKLNNGVNATTTAIGAGGAIPGFLYSDISQVLNKYPNAFVGAGAGSGQSKNTNSASNIVSGKGGNGGSALVIECGGAWNFTTASGISVAGEAGGNADSTGASNDYNAGGGGGGGGGYFLALYNTLTANSGTVTATGGLGGNGKRGVSADTHYGGGGGGSATNAGIDGTSSTTNNAKTGGDGGNGISNIIQNTLSA